MTGPAHPDSRTGQTVDARGEGAAWVCKSRRAASDGVAVLGPTAIRAVVFGSGLTVGVAMRLNGAWGQPLDLWASIGSAFGLIVAPFSFYLALLLLSLSFGTRHGFTWLSFACGFADGALLIGHSLVLFMVAAPLLSAGLTVGVVRRAHDDDPRPRAGCRDDGGEEGESPSDVSGR